MVERAFAQAMGMRGYSASNNAFSGDSANYTLISSGDSAKDHLVALQSGWHKSAVLCKDLYGDAADGIITDGKVVDETDDVVTCKGKGCVVEDFLGLQNNCPIFLTGLKINVDNPAQLDEEIQFVKISPAGTKEIKRVVPSAYKNEANMDSKLVSIDLTDDAIVLGPDTSVFMKVQAGRSVNLTWFYKNKLSIRDMARALNE